ncbi:hypothetical protein TeGR_g14323, partial [Tetraparma gracilis]
YTATVDHDGPQRWAVDAEEVPHLNKLFKKDDTIKCESGLCFSVDFHIDLGGQTEAERTMFGNPGNDPVTGLERGTFFLYDPTVIAGGEVDWWRSNVPLIAGLVLTALIGMIAGCCFCCVRRRKANRKKAASEKVDGGDREDGML